MLARLSPIRGWPQQRQIWAWISYDVANQSFTLLVNTLLFSLFFTRVVVNDPSRDDVLWSLTYSISMLLVVIASPFVGAVADARAWKKWGLMLTGVVCAVLTCLMGLIPQGGLLVAVLIYIPANFCFSVGENFLAAFLPALARQDQLGRLSGFSWACAYAAALLLLVLTAGAMVMFDLKQPDQWRPLLVFAGMWFLVFMVPTLLYLREGPAPARAEPGHPFRVGLRRLQRSVREIRRFRDLATLLVASVFYGTAMSVVIFFASILAKEFGFGDVDLVVFTGVITISGVLGTLGPTFFQDRIGHRRSTVILLLLWLATSLALAVVSWRYHAAPDPSLFPRWPIWVIGNLLGLGLGSLGSANRAFVAYLTPPDRSAEFFGLWGLVFKIAAIGTIPFAVVKDVIGTTASCLVLAGFVVAGLLLTLFIDERRGAAAASAPTGGTHPTSAASSAGSPA